MTTPLGLRLADVNIGERRLFITEGKGGRQRIVPISSRFFATLGAYIDEERPRTSATERLFVVLKGPVAAGRCRRMGSTRSWRVPARVLVCRT